MIYFQRHHYICNGHVICINPQKLKYLNMVVSIDSFEHYRAVVSGNAVDCQTRTLFNLRLELLIASHYAAINACAFSAVSLTLDSVTRSNCYWVNCLFKGKHYIKIWKRETFIVHSVLNFHCFYVNQKCEQKVGRSHDSTVCGKTLPCRIVVKVNRVGNLILA